MTDPDRQRTLFAVGIKHVVNTPHGRFEVRREQTTGEFRYICEICGEDFPTTQSLGSHRTYVHTRGEGAITDSTIGGDVLALLQQPAESASSVGAPEDDAELAGEPPTQPLTKISSSLVRVCVILLESKHICEGDLKRY